MRTTLFILVTLLTAGCAGGTALRGDVTGLGRPDVPRAVSVDVDATGNVATQEAVRAGALKALRESKAVTLAGPGSKRDLRLHLRVEKAAEPAAPGSGDGFPVAIHLGESDAAGRLVVRGELTDSSGALLGRLAWDASGKPEDRGEAAGAAIASAVDASARSGPDPYAIRRASDDRLFLTPSALTLRPGTLELSDEEVLALRLAVGLSNRVQLNFMGGALPIPVAGASALPIPGAFLGGGAAALALGTMFDAGVKVRILDEGPRRPAISVSYDLVDVAASVVAAAGGGGVGGDGAVAAGGVGVGNINLQFNLFSVAATKHFGRHQLTLGTYVLDNHHFLPQSAGAAGVVVMGSSGGTGGAGAAGGSTPIDRVPVQVEPFASYSYQLGAHSLLAVETFPWISLRPMLGTTGVRWTLGNGERVLGVDLQHTTVRIDAAVMWFYLKGDPSKNEKGGVGYVPWLGVGLAFN